MIPRYIAGLLMLFVIDASAQSLRLQDAEQIALRLDPAAEMFQQQQQQFAAQAIAQSQLADPMLKLGLGNLPIDSFALDQDPMTQVSLGLAQQFSRGDTLSLNANSFNQRSEQSIQLAQNRQLELSRNIRNIWFEIRFAHQAQQLIKQNQRLFKQNVEHVRSQFELGYKQSQDLIQAELQLNKFDEQIAAFYQQEQALRGRLASWLGAQAFDAFSEQLPHWDDSVSYAMNGTIEHYSLLGLHPKVQAAQKSIDVAENQIAIANQAYKPAFKVEVGYGHRRATEMDGSRRSDLLSGFVTMDVPLFTDKRQDQGVIAAQRGKGIKRAEKDILMTTMNGMLNGAVARYSNTHSRIQRYQTTLLEQAKQNTAAVLQGYQSNTLNFEQVIKAFMDELALSLEYQQLTSIKYKALADVRYYQAK
ncbi:TolC family protein [Agarivorans sp. TSD2052]|uniref:TolC family protein n=1 Tax=Agarivorans sp. TSD2052 TaxID=2937286 RepID=UPI00200C491D|nr:TolC family protein [Agarivorans sp. TSD2052]UPW17539.1 TolC family protein [Agarivorans sp. TSD2052]